MIKNAYQKFSELVYEQRTHIYWCCGLMFLAVCLLGQYLISNEFVLSHEGTDISMYYYHSFSLAHEGFLRGELIKWNPYEYGGISFLGSMQTGLLYPINWLFACLPVGLALNWIMFVHVWLIGVGMYGWMVCRGVKPVAAFVSGAALMFSGPFFLHIYGGHVPLLGSLAWVPFVFWGIEGWLRKRHPGWLALSSLAAAGQIYAGIPQFFYYGAIAAGLYSLLRLPEEKEKKSAALGLLCVYPLALLLSAAQLLPSLGYAAESVRSGGMSYEDASVFALPVENFLTLLAPWFFGGIDGVPYWAKCYIWEMQLYCGIGILWLAVFGWLQFKRGRRITYAVYIGIIFLLALGVRTPLYQILYHCFPGFDMFRGTSKFSFFAVLMTIALAGQGFDCLLTHGGSRRFRWAWLGLGGGVLVLSFGFMVRSGSAGWFAELLKGLAEDRESYLIRGFFNQPGSVLAAETGSGASLIMAGVWLIVFGALWLLVRRVPKVAWLFMVLALVELMVFAYQSIDAVAVAKLEYKPLAEVLKNNPGDYRTLNLINPMANVTLRSENLWGYDPLPLKRYAELMCFSQGVNPDMAGQYLSFRQNSPIFALLRGRMAFAPGEKGISVQPLQEPFPRFFIVSKYRVMQGREPILEALFDKSFDPKKEVILEQDPLLPPDFGDTQYQIRLLNHSTDHWTLEIMTTRSSVLVMTDAYSKDWRVQALPGSVQTNYDLLPADYALRGIPLAPGRHIIRIEYIPAGFHLGLLISGLSLLALAVVLLKPVLCRGLLPVGTD
jgi:hypothetical protein